MVCSPQGQIVFLEKLCVHFVTCTFWPHKDCFLLTTIIVITQVVLGVRRIQGHFTPQRVRTHISSLSL